MPWPPLPRRHRPSLEAAGLAAAVLLAPAPLLAAAPPATRTPEAAAPSAPTAPAAPAYERSETAALVAFVERAAAEIRSRGEASFADFRQPGGPWLEGDRYLFVWDLQGNRYVYPPDLEHESGNQLEMQDFTGRAVGRMLVEQAASPGGRGWVHYQWRRTNRDDRRPVWKSTYVLRATAPSGRTYLVGSGLYESPIEKAFVVQEVDAAAELLRLEGRAAFPRLRDRRGRFWFHETYVFVDTPAGEELVNPAFAEVEGRNILNLRDLEGRPMVREYIDLAMRRGSGWTTYLWPRPDGSKTPARKHTYVRRVQTPTGETLIVGAGVYER
ncbi:MAG: cache domain-containing protein [Synechococcaceae cyanobacterium]|nr:cache domain-containing protein [Synechococcaceae cyanobacterium]